MARPISPTDFLMDGTAVQRFPSEFALPVKASKSSAPMSATSGISMRQLWMKRKTVAHMRETVAERVVEFLRARHPSKTAECVAAETGLNVHTLRKLIERQSAPSLATFGRLGAVYGSPFVSAVFEWDWLDADKADAENDRIEKMISELRERQRELRA
jgi:hypothetical protein